ncbi:armadillo-type protein [Naematelia encephala]|uniref:Armadillo-type protein n=1 Tax=Naematelia encephala TaxID=71784 RepID=A0A1Y2BJK2_9TREE|nr:armadillo-type protein [Naematelia encephala]
MTSSTFQPFSPWTPPGVTLKTPTAELTPPKEKESPRNASAAWQGQFGRWSTDGGYLGATGGSLSDLGIARKPLGELQGTNVPALSLASPFHPQTEGLWAPPGPTLSTVSRQRLEELVAQADARILELTKENERLKRAASQFRASSIPSQISYTSPPLSSHSSGFFDNYQHMHTGFSGLGLGMTRFEDPEMPMREAVKNIGDNDSDLSARLYAPPSFLVSQILQGTFDFNFMHHEYMRPIVWIIANRQPRNPNEGAGLKAAVNALASRLTCPRETQDVVVLINAIIEFAKPLCFTSCGNYLCQQLLERGDVDDKMNFIKEIQHDVVSIASDKFGTHVLCKAIAVKELEAPISEALLKAGIFDSMKTGARRLWREYLEKCRQSGQLAIFERINADMQGRWADLACSNEHGSIAVQQVFEVFGSEELMEPCFQEILTNISRIANNQFGHFIIAKLLGYSAQYRPTCEAILTAYPPVATTHHGVNFAKVAVNEGGRSNIVKYIESICRQDNGRTPGIVAIATSSIGKAHLNFVLSCINQSELARIRTVCRSFSTTLRNSQSGNDLLRSLGLIHAGGPRHRTGAT